LFQVVRSLSNKPEENQLPPHDDPRKLADDFGELLSRKVDLLEMTLMLLLLFQQCAKCSYA